MLTSVDIQTAESNYVGDRRTRTSTTTKNNEESKLAGMQAAHIRTSTGQ